MKNLICLLTISLLSFTGSSQEDWFNQGDHVDKISKQVKSIYERIVRGDVDNNNSKL